MTNHPHLKSLHTLFTAEVQPFRKVHRMIDLFESIIKSHTVVILAEYVKCNDLSDTAKGMLSQGLRTPSLGTWQLFSRVLFEELEGKEYQWTIHSFVDEFKHLDKALNNDKTNVIAFRNGYAHGATPSDEQCEKDIERFEPFLNLLLSSKWLKQSSTHVKDGLVYLKSQTDSLCLHPILLHREENSDASFAFFNDLKNDKIGLLNYPLGKHYREREFFKEFHNYLPLNEWKKSGNNEFYQRIEELTETFKGRTAERDNLLQFVLNESKGYCSIQGNPGIGKSALIAQFFKDLRGSKEASSVQVVEYFIRRGTAQAQTEYLLNYLIKRTDEVFPQGKEVRAEGKMVFDLQQQLFSKWRLWSEHSNGKKLLFLIDGLDEGVENNVVSYLPRENFDDILIIYGSRPGGHKTIDELWATLPIENHTKIALSGLSKEDIRALLYEVSNKYDLERESEWIEVVQQRSQGNPLYLKLLCDSLENKVISLNDVNALPTKIDEYYKAILLRYAQDPDGDALLAGLYTFAAAKDYLTFSHLGLINQLGDAVLERIGSTLKEVLYENPLTEDVLDYQLFHESFREYLVKEKALKVNEASYRIIDFCSSWKDLQGQFEQRYTLEHYAAHLHESKKEIHTEQLLKLIYDSEFQTTQKKVLRGFEASNALFRLALLKASEVQRFDEQLEAGLCLVDLKYEEANDAPQIVAMVAAGEIDLALKRIESFGGADKEGMQRKFTLYMLCLMELTLLDSKDKPFRKEGIERLLNHLDEQIPPDTSLINWNVFFPSNLIFKMAFVWAELGLNYLIIFFRTDYFDIDWIDNKSDFNDCHLEVIKEVSNLFSQFYLRSDVLSALGTLLFRMAELDKSATMMNLAIEHASSIASEILRNVAFNNISIQFSKQGKYNEALIIADRISENKNETISRFSVEFASQSQFDEILKFAEEITDEVERVSIMGLISSQLFKLNKLSRAEKLLKKATEYALAISGHMSRNRALKEISIICAEQEIIDKALFYARLIDDMSNRCYALSGIANKLYKQGQLDNSDLIIAESIECIHSITNSFLVNSAYVSVSISLVEQGKFVQAGLINYEILERKSGFFDEEALSEKLLSISNELSQNDFLEKSLVFAKCIPKEDERIKALISLSTCFYKANQKDFSSSLMQEAIDLALNNEDDWQKNSALVTITEELASQGFVKKAITLARSIENLNQRSWALGKISTYMYSKLHYKFSSELGNEAIDDVLKMHEFERINALGNLSLEFYNQNKIDLANQLIRDSLKCCENIEEGYMRDMFLMGVYIRMARQGNVISTHSVVEDMLEPLKSLAHEAILEIQANDIELEQIDYNSLDNFTIKPRQNFWRLVGGRMNSKEGLLTAIDKIALLKGDESLLFYLRGVSESLKLMTLDKQSIQSAISFFAGDAVSLENLMRAYALRSLLFAELDEKFLARLNRTLNIQWALDIAAQFPKTETKCRLSTNLESWLHEIADEDDREQIELWAKQVTKGKISEEEFGVRVESLMN